MWVILSSQHYRWHCFNKIQMGSIDACKRRLRWVLYSRRSLMTIIWSSGQSNATNVEWEPTDTLSLRERQFGTEVQSVFRTLRHTSARQTVCHTLHVCGQVGPNKIVPKCLGSNVSSYRYGWNLTQRINRWPYYNRDCSETSVNWTVIYIYIYIHTSIWLTVADCFTECYVAVTILCQHRWVTLTLDRTASRDTDHSAATASHNTAAAAAAGRGHIDSSCSSCSVRGQQFVSSCTHTSRHITWCIFTLHRQLHTDTHTHTASFHVNHG